MMLVIKNLPANAGDTEDVGSILGWEDPLEEEMATHSSILAWEFPWTQKSGRLQSTGSQRVRHDEHSMCSQLSIFLDLLLVSRVWEPQNSMVYFHFTLFSVTFIQNRNNSLKMLWAFCESSWGLLH